MGRHNPDPLVAHVDLLRAVDRLLEQAQVVREKRNALDRLLTPDRQPGGRTSADGKEARDAS
jgi:hypothetical protein